MSDETGTVVQLPLINKYRPRQFRQVIGHVEMLTALERALSTDSHPHAFLLTGPSGVGKTTIARIIGEQLSAEIIEIDAATNTGVDAMRDLVDLSLHVPMTGGSRMVIIDEAHMLSRSAFNAALKLLEEPPAHLYIALCTTELTKIPETIRTRCFHILLRPVASNDLADLLDYVCDREAWQVSEEVMRQVIAAATGQPRKALSLLQACQGIKSEREVARIIALQESGDALVQILRLFLDSDAPRWERLQPLLVAIPDDDMDTASIGAGRYLSAVIGRATSEKAARHAWTLLDALLFPSQTWDRKAMLYAAIGRLMWGR